MDTFELSSPGWVPTATLLLIAAAILGVIVYAMRRSAARKPHSIIVGLAVAIAVVMPAIQLFMMHVHRSANLEPDRLTVKTSFYETVVEFKDIRSVREEASHTLLERISYRSNGMGLPGYRSGWFMMKEGRKLFASVTDDPTIYIATSGGYDIALSLPDTQTLVRRLEGVVQPSMRNE
ncbi:MAG: putative transrane protein [Paucimonas sp.]|jgi:hypothetical protein|nr:putative transrane protein [Paucimonas sp.]